MYQDDEDLIEQVSDEDGDAMVEDDDNRQAARPRQGREIPDDEPPLEGYERYVEYLGGMERVTRYDWYLPRLKFGCCRIYPMLSTQPTATMLPQLNHHFTTERP